MANPDLKNRELREGHLKWTNHWCRGLAAALIVVLAAGLSGCVESADCERDVDCRDDRICYQARCLSECEEDADCEEGQRCAPCNPDGGADRCPDADTGGCVAAEP